MVIIYYEGKSARLIRGVGTYRNGRKKPDKYVKTIRYITSKADERERNARCEKNGALKAYHNTERAPSKSDAIAMIATVYNDRRFGRAKTNKISIVRPPPGLFPHGYILSPTVLYVVIL